MSRCPDICLVPTWTRPHGGRVHYTQAAAEASYDGGQSVSHFNRPMHADIHTTRHAPMSDKTRVYTLTLASFALYGAVIRKYEPLEN